METDLTEYGVGVLRALMSADTQNPPGNEKTLLDTIMRNFVPATASSSVIPHGGNRASLVVILPGRRDTTVGFTGHLDTVPSGPRESWSRDPFGAVIQGGFAYGRGASDMRGGLCAMLLLLKHYASRFEAPPITLRFIFTADEESGGTGANALYGDGFFDGLSCLFVCEPTGCNPGIAEKGTVWMTLHVTGICGHAAIPWASRNALEYGFDFLSSLGEKIGRLPTHPLLGGCTCSVTKASAGYKTNIIPAEADFSADIRFVPPLSAGDIRRLASESAAQKEKAADGVSFRLDFPNVREALQAPEGEMLTRLERVFGRLELPFQRVGIHFYTDASLVIPHTKQPFVILGPGEQNECHKTDEKVELSSIWKAFNIYREFIDSFL